MEMKFQILPKSTKFIYAIDNLGNSKILTRLKVIEFRILKTFPEYCASTTIECLLCVFTVL